MKFKHRFIYLIASVYAILHSWLYWLRFRKSKKNSHRYFLVHIPKTAGQSLVDALGIDSPGHFPAKKIMGLTDCEKIVVVVRDPVDRIFSIFKYSRKKNHLNKVLSPLFMMRLFSDVNLFVKSPVFDAFCRFHYFFKPSSYFLDGVELDDERLIVIRFSSLDSDLLNSLGLKLGRVNISPPYHGQSISLDTKEKIELAYLSDANLCKRFGC